MSNPLLLLHGAIASKDQMAPLQNSLSDQYDVHSLSFSGHGGNALPNQLWNMDLYAQDVLAQ